MYPGYIMLVKILTCPACQSPRLVKNGHTRHGNQRVKCHQWGKTNVLTPHLRYATGTYWSGSQAFRVNILMRQTKPGHYRIHTIQVSE
jgi:transposase-like protein